MKYRTKKTDNNQKAIVAELRKIPGVSVITDHDDILVGYKGKTYWFEIKNPDEVTKSGKIRRNKSGGTQERQEKLRDTWTGHYKIVSTLKEILDEIQGLY